MQTHHQKPLRVVIGCDADPDRPDFGGVPYNAGCRRQTWRGIECIQSLRERLNRITDSNGRPVAVTWLLRCDEQVERTEGASDFLIRTYSTLWKLCEASGDEIGWHPHFWRLSPDGKTWFQDIHDEAFQTRMLRDNFQAFSHAWGQAPCSVRMGWVYHNNTTLAELADLGVSIDFSALPYQKYAGTKSDRGAGFAGYFDWSATGTSPYFPSKKNFQLPGEGDDKLCIVELPIGILQSKFIGFLLETRRAMRAHSCTRLAKGVFSGKTAVKVSFSVTFFPWFFRVLVHDVLARGEDWFVAFFHADELLPDKGQMLNNWLYKADYFVDNMKILLRQAAKAGRKVEFVTATEAAEIFRSSW